MIGLIFSLSIAQAEPDEWKPGLERVEILSEDPGTWIHHELPLAHHRPSTAAVRFIEQVQPVWRSPWRGLVVGTSLAVQTLQFEQPIGEEGLGWSAGIQTKLLCPRGVVAAISWQWRSLHLNFGISASSTASWQHLHWNQWSALPTAGIGFSR